MNPFLGSVLFLWVLQAFAATSPHDHLSPDSFIIGADPKFAKYLFYSNLPSSSTKAEKFSDEGKIIYSVNYKIDSFRRRYNPYNDKNSPDNQLIFMGCSVTFGEGLEDDQTIPAQIARLTRKTQTWNYGTSGYGPGHVLSYLRYFDLTPQISKSGKVSLIFLWGDYLFDRANGSLVHLFWGGDIAPFYSLESDHLEFRGSVSKNFPFKRALARVLFNIPLFGGWLLKYLSMRNPANSETQHDVDLSLQILKESYLEYRRQFNNDRFYVAFYPYSSFSREKLRGPLEESGIKVIDLTDAFQNVKNPTEMVIRDDGHPSATGALMIARGIIRALALQ